VKSAETKRKAYASAGVDVDLGNRLKRRIQHLVGKTHGPEVLGKIGGFGGLFATEFFRNACACARCQHRWRRHKIKNRVRPDKHDTVGADLVNHCVNDIAVVGARPLFFLDYIGCEKLEPRVFNQLLHGFSRSCRSAHCALIGGETGQMPGMYRKGEYDLAGCIIGVVDRSKIINGRKIKPGDVILGLASNGLHTNGYSLARKILFEKMRLTLRSRLPGLNGAVGRELLRVHKNYQPLLAKVPSGMLKGLAHITGGGLVDNLPRILPKNCDAVIDTKSWRVPPSSKSCSKRKCRSTRNVSGLQHGDWHGGGCIATRREARNVDVERKTHRSRRAWNRRNPATVLTRITRIFGSHRFL